MLPEIDFAQMSRAEAKEGAYQIWLACGQNYQEAERTLKGGYGYAVSRQTLSKWAEEGDWLGRSARDAAAQVDLDEALTTESMLRELLAQKSKYETYFRGLGIGEVNNQAMYAYSGILKTIISIKPKENASADIDRPKLFLDDLQFIAETLSEIDPEGLKVLGRNIDALTARFKEQHEAQA